MMRLTLILVLVVFGMLQTAAAGGNESGERVITTKSKKAKAEPTPNQASDASFDKRLPPVLPGELVNDSGRKMRVWSTAGPVPVADAPEPWRKDAVSSGGNRGTGIGDVSVIVDKRKDQRHHSGRDVKRNSSINLKEGSGGIKVGKSTDTYSYGDK